MNSWEKNSISPEFHPATKPLTVEPVDSGNEIAQLAIREIEAYRVLTRPQSSSYNAQGERRERWVPTKGAQGEMGREKGGFFRERWIFPSGLLLVDNHPARKNPRSAARTPKTL